MQHKIRQARIPEADDVTTKISIYRKKHTEEQSKKKRSLSMLEGIAEDQIAAAMRRGEFKDLKGAGKPLKTYRNPHVDVMTARVQGMMQEQGFTPDWVDSQIMCRKQQDQLRIKMRREWIRLQKTIHQADAATHDVNASITPTAGATTAGALAAAAAAVAAAKPGMSAATMLPSDLATVKGMPGYILWKHSLDEIKEVVAPLNKKIFDHNLNCPNGTTHVHAFSLERELKLLDRDVHDGTLSIELEALVTTATASDTHGSTTRAHQASSSAASSSTAGDARTNRFALAVLAFAVVIALYRHKPDKPTLDKTPAVRA